MRPRRRAPDARAGALGGGRTAPSALLAARCALSPLYAQGRAPADARAPHADSCPGVQAVAGVQAAVLSPDIRGTGGECTCHTDPKPASAPASDLFGGTRQLCPVSSFVSVVAISGVLGRQGVNDTDARSAGKLVVLTLSSILKRCRDSWQKCRMYQTGAHHPHHTDTCIALSAPFIPIHNSTCIITLAHLKKPSVHQKAELSTELSASALPRRAEAHLRGVYLQRQEGST